MPQAIVVELELILEAQGNKGMTSALQIVIRFWDMHGNAVDELLSASFSKRYRYEWQQDFSKVMVR